MKEKEENPNMVLYNSVREVPQGAIKVIGAGRLKGMSDINPMWRIKRMTEIFGACGTGWKYTVTKQWEMQLGNEIKVFTNIEMRYKVNGEWSEPIFGTGGSSLLSIERNGPYASDEGYKMSLTDALSVAMKSIGVAADIYFNKDADYGTKYAYQQSMDQNPNQQNAQSKEIEDALIIALDTIKQAQSVTELTRIFNELTALQSDKRFISALSARKKEVGDDKTK